MVARETGPPPDDLHECDTQAGGPPVRPYELISLLQGPPFIPEPLVAPSLIAFVPFPLANVIPIASARDGRRHPDIASSAQDDPVNVR